MFIYFDSIIRFEETVKTMYTYIYPYGELLGGVFTDKITKQYKSYNHTILI